MTNFAKRIDSPVGPILLLANEQGLSGVYFREPARDYPAPAPGSAAAGFLARAEAELGEYFAGKRKEFTVPLHAEGTPFQKKVWAELSKIGFGVTKSYAELARAAGNEKATRAVGTANGRNPLSIIVPCHRVIAADGSLGGYSGGLDKKIRLLELEKSSFRAGKQR